MANNTRESKRSSRDPWIPAAINGVNGGTAATNGEDAVEEWLPAQKPRTTRRNGRAARNGSSAGPPETANGSSVEHASEDQEKSSSSHAPRRRHRLPKHASPRERWLIFRLRRSRRREEELRAQVEELRARISKLEVQAEPAKGNGSTPKHEPANGNGGSLKRSPAKRKPSITASEAAAGKRKPTAAQAKRSRPGTSKTAPPRRGSKLDLNAATFDQLRGLGLTINQTSRVISHREQAGGFAQVEELEEIRGLSRATIAELRSQVRVGSR